MIKLDSDTIQTLYIGTFGKLFKVTAICEDGNETNEYLALDDHGSEGVLATDNQGRVYIAESEAVTASYGGKNEN